MGGALDSYTAEVGTKQGRKSADGGGTCWGSKSNCGQVSNMASTTRYNCATTDETSLNDILEGRILNYNVGIVGEGWMVNGEVWDEYPRCKADFPGKNQDRA